MRGERIAAALALQQARRLAGDARAGGAERVAERDRAAVEVQHLVANAEFAHARQGLRGEGLVEFDDVDRADLDIGALQRLARRRDRADAHDVRLAAGHRHRGEARQRLKVVALGEFFRADEHRGGAVGQRRRGAGGDRALLVEGRLQPSQRLGRGVGADAAVLFHRRPVGFDGHDLVGQLAGGLRGGGLLVAAQRQFLLRRAGDLPAPRHILRRLAHRHVGAGHLGVQRRVRHRVEAAGRHARHALDAGADEGLAGAKADLPGGDMDRVHRGAAEPVDGCAPDAQRQVGLQRDEARHVEPLLGLREGAAENQILDLGRVDAGALHQSPHHFGDEIVGPHLGQRAFLGEREGGAGIACDDDVLHGFKVPGARPSGRWRSIDGGGLAAARVGAGEDRGGVALEIVEPLQGLVDRHALGRQLLAPFADALQQHARLRHVFGIGIVEVEIALDLAQAEAELLAAQDQDHAGALAVGIGAGGTDATRRDQPLVLVEAQGAGADAELVREIRHRHQRLEHVRHGAAPARRIGNGCRRFAHAMPTGAGWRVVSSATSSLREILPTAVFGSSVRSSITFGRSIFER